MHRDVLSHLRPGDRVLQVLAREVRDTAVRVRARLVRQEVSAVRDREVRVQVEPSAALAPVALRELPEVRVDQAAAGVQVEDRARAVDVVPRAAVVVVGVVERTISSRR